MTSTRIPVLAAAAFVCVLLASACTSRPAAPGGSANNPETCVYCHGTVGRVGNLPGTDRLLPSAPPSAPNGKPAAVVGAHQVHLNPPIDGPLRAPIACNECHVVPQNLQHATNPPANPVQFGVLARAQGASPTYEPLSLGCAAVYCHGNFDFNGVKGKAASVVWDGGVVGCGACHDLPPTGHPPLPGSVTPATCSQCHPSTVNANGSINVASGAHINGLAEVSYSCTACHGTAGRVGFQEGTDPNLASAPPIAPAGAPSPRRRRPPAAPEPGRHRLDARPAPLRRVPRRSHHTGPRHDSSRRQGGLRPAGEDPGRDPVLGLHDHRLRGHLLSRQLRLQRRDRLERHAALDRWTGRPASAATACPRRVTPPSPEP